MAVSGNDVYQMLAVAVQWFAWDLKSQSTHCPLNFDLILGG